MLVCTMYLITYDSWNSINICRSATIKKILDMNGEHIYEPNPLLWSLLIPFSKMANYQLALILNITTLIILIPLNGQITEI